MPVRLTDWHVKAIQKQIAGDTGGAMALWAKVLERNAHDAKALYFMALAYYQIHELERAIGYMRACLHEAPAHADGWFNLAKFLHHAGRPADALKHYIAALEHEPAKVEALTNAGSLFYQLGDEPAALECFRVALAQDTNNPDALYARSFVRLVAGDYARGWLEYEARWSCDPFKAEFGRTFMKSLPRWNGALAALPGRMLLHGEQGAGDLMLMLRYVPHLPADRIVLEVLPSLTSLCQTLFPDVEIVSRGAAIPNDVVTQCPTMSLPLLFGTEIETIPPPLPEVAIARVPISSPCLCGRLHVGLCWAGSKAYPYDADRSAPVHAFAPLFAIAGIHWVSLQVGDRENEYEFEDVRALTPFLASASVIRGLDMVVSVDTAVAHLAGLLGCPLHLITQSSPYWLWLLNRGESPWYPSARLWRRAADRPWAIVIEELCVALRASVQLHEP
jgi:hypothetical protein